MAYQSEAQLEQQLIEQLQNQKYSTVSLPARIYLTIYLN